MPPRPGKSSAGTPSSISLKCWSTWSAAISRPSGPRLVWSEDSRGRRLASGSEVKIAGEQSLGDRTPKNLRRAIGDTRLANSMKRFDEAELVGESDGAVGLDHPIDGSDRDLRGKRLRHRQL